MWTWISLRSSSKYENFQIRHSPLPLFPTSIFNRIISFFRRVVGKGFTAVFFFSVQKCSHFGLFLRSSWFGVFSFFFRRITIYLRTFWLICVRRLIFFINLDFFGNVSLLGRSIICFLRWSFRFAFSSRLFTAYTWNLPIKWYLRRKWKENIVLYLLK